MPTDKPFFPNLRPVKKVSTPQAEILIRKECKCGQKFMGPETQKPAYWVMVVLAANPMLLLLLTWLGWLSPPASVSAVRMFLLIVATGSYVWLVLAMKFPMFLGESYSRGRFGIILVNLVGMVICSIAAIRGKERRKVMFVLACILTTLVSSLVGAVNSVV